MTTMTMTMAMANILFFRHDCPYNIKNIQTIYNIKIVMVHQNNLMYVIESYTDSSKLYNPWMQFQLHQFKAHIYDNGAWSLC